MRRHLLGVFPYAAGWLGRHAASTDDAVVHDGQADEWQYYHSIEVLQALGLNPSVGCSPFARFWALVVNTWEGKGRE